MHETGFNESNNGINGVSSGLTILEEYQNKIEDQKKELQEKFIVIKNLQKDYEYLMQSSNNDIKRLESKEQEIERLKRSLSKLQKENAEIKASQRNPNHYQAPGGKSTAANKSNEPAPKKRYTFGQPASPKATPGLKRDSTKLPLAQQTELVVAQELEIDISKFNDMFIENLSQQLSGVFGKKGH